MSADQADPNNSEDFSETSKTEEDTNVVELQKKHRSIRDVGHREIGFLKKLVSDYPGFESLTAGDQLDRMVLVLQSACGYGAVSKRIIGQIQEQLQWHEDFDVDRHFSESSFDSLEANCLQTRYRESFEGAFCLKREYMNRLANDGEAEPNNEPIRKKMPKKAVAATKQNTVSARKPTVGKMTASSKPSMPAPVALNSVHETSSTHNTEVGVNSSAPSPSQNMVSIHESDNREEVIATKDVGSSLNLGECKAGSAGEPSSLVEVAKSPDEPSFQVKPWMILASLGLLVIIVALAFLL